MRKIIVMLVCMLSLILASCSAGDDSTAIEIEADNQFMSEAIREAGKNLKTYDLSGCELYTTGEPCQMCLYAILWARIDKVYYGCTIEDNADIGFRDEKLDDLAGGREAMEGMLTCIDREACLELFEVYKEMNHEIY